MNIHNLMSECKLSIKCLGRPFGNKKQDLCIEQSQEAYSWNSF